jgi:glucokinase
MGEKKKKYLIGIDLGGTKVLMGLLDKNFRVCREYKADIDANQGEKAFLKTLFGGIEVLFKEGRITSKNILAVGVGCPGIIRFPKGVVKLSNNIAFLKNYPLQAKLSKYLKVPVLLENDANAGLYGEYKLGAAKKKQYVIGIFLGTGVGGALILDGKLYRGASGSAGEIGHTLLSMPSFLQGHGIFETVGATLGRLGVTSEAALLLLKQRAPHLFNEVGYNIKRVKSRTLLRAIEGGDKAIKGLVLDKGKMLGVVMANLANVLNPEMIVLGGGMIEAMEHIILPEARRVMETYLLKPLVGSVKVVPSKLKDYAVVKGAAKLAHNFYFKKKRIF